MAQVLVFPVKKKLPKHIEERLHENAKEYMELLYAALMLLGEDGVDQYAGEEIIDMVADAYVEGLNKAVDELE